MTLYGVAILAACFLAGRALGEQLGAFVGIDANVGGVGFAMLLLIFALQALRKYDSRHEQSETGVTFWSELYIPVIVAMSSVQNVQGAISGGVAALVVGILPTACCFFLVPFIAGKNRNDTAT
jgi:malonate transporter MadL subunit